MTTYKGTEEFYLDEIFRLTVTHGKYMPYISGRKYSDEVCDRCCLGDMCSFISFDKYALCLTCVDQITRELEKECNDGQEWNNGHDQYCYRAKPVDEDSNKDKYTFSCNIPGELPVFHRPNWQGVRKAEVQRPRTPEQVNRVAEEDKNRESPNPFETPKNSSTVDIINALFTNPAVQNILSNAFKPVNSATQN